MWCFMTAKWDQWEQQLKNFINDCIYMTCENTWSFYIMSNAAQRNKPFKPPYWYIHLSAIVTTAKSLSCYCIMRNIVKLFLFSKNSRKWQNMDSCLFLFAYSFFSPQTLLTHGTRPTLFVVKVGGTRGRGNAMLLHTYTQKHTHASKHSSLVALHSCKL